MLDLPTAFWHELVCTWPRRARRCRTVVRLVVIGGEAVDPARLADWRALPGADRVRLLNTYGATETTLITHAAELHGPAGREPAVGAPIGRPLAARRRAHHRRRRAAGRRTRPGPRVPRAARGDGRALRRGRRRAATSAPATACRPATTGCSSTRPARRPGQGPRHPGRPGRGRGAAARPPGRRRGGRHRRHRRRPHGARGVRRRPRPRRAAGPARRACAVPARTGARPPAARPASPSCPSSPAPAAARSTAAPPTTATSSRPDSRMRPDDPRRHRRDRHPGHPPGRSSAACWSRRHRRRHGLLRAGGDSLLATRVLSAIARDHRRRADLRRLRASPRPRRPGRRRSRATRP